MATRAAKAATVRTRHASVVKKTIDAINAFTATTACASLVVYRDELDLNWSNYATAFDEHEDAIVGKDDNELQTITAEFSTIHSAFLVAKTHINGLISTANGGANLLNSSISQEDTVKSVKLPPCKLMTFSGELKDWVEFKATFRSMLTDKIPDVQRLQFLKEALKGEPRELVAHILPADGAYEKAMLLLKNRFENTRAIVNDHLRRLYTLKRNVPEKESITTLRSIVNAINGLKASLAGCDIDTSTWNSILIYNTSQCLHPYSLKSWEEKLEGQRSIPTLQTYLEWLETRINILETTQDFCVPENNRSKFASKSFQSKPHQFKEPVKTLYTLKADFKCIICSQNHIQTRCDALPKMSSQEKKEVISKHNLCSNCLQMHNVEQCPFTPACKKCSGNHHTVLHEGSSKIMLTNIDATTEEQVDDDSEVMSQICSEHFYHVSMNSSTLLATAVVSLRWNGRCILVNALIDLGATANLISERTCKILNLPIQPTTIPMTGVGDSPVGYVIGCTVGTIGSVHDKDFNLNIDSIVVKNIANTPQIDHNKLNEWTHLHDLPLADPNFLDAHRIDILLGASVCSEIMLPGQHKVRGQPIAQETVLGYIIYGPIELNVHAQALCYTLKHNISRKESENLSLLLRSFWEIEEVEFTKPLTNDEQAAEDIFIKSLKRTNDGKFMVDLPFKVDASSDCLGESRELAEKRLRANQRRLNKTPEIKQLCDQNLNEYLTLGHMVELNENEIPRNFLPHHHVVKASSTTTKVRNVFDASAKTSNGRSLNDILYVGPTIQSNLFELLIQWRRYEFAFCGDIEKMYRQVWVNPEHALYQCILWQSPTSDKIKAYKLITVTFGTASAPFQAIRALDEIGVRIQESQPELSELIRKHFYVDDFLGSSSSIEKATQMRESITNELAQYGFHLRKWKASDDRILNGLDDSERDGVIDFLTTFKTLGILWQPSCDSFQFKSTQPKHIETWTKRSVLSEIAKLFDPLGWLAPCVAQAKMIMQEIWKLPTMHDWDKPLPSHIIIKWKLVYEQLCLPISIQVPRWIGMNDDVVQIEIHGFCDASIKAYAAAVYVKVCYKDGHSKINLIAAKTKLAPVKTISIPRLELCGAVLLTRLFGRCVKALALNNFKLYAWSDSMIVLAWLAACPSRWSVFVATRVTEIQRDLPFENWKHVPSELNPADIASRGATVSDLIESKMWWHGPDFLLDLNCWPMQTSQLPIDEIPERSKKEEVLQLNVLEPNHVLQCFSKLTRLLRFTALVMRWHSRKKNAGPIKASEIAKAKSKWVRIVQQEVFARDIDAIKRNRQAPTPSIQQLNPFIDSDGILRMNGRVGNADMLQHKTAQILPAVHHFTELVILDAHEFVLHGGVQLTLRKLRDDYWIIHARNQVKKKIHKCITCFRDRKPMMGQKMAELPPFRTEAARPFAFVGCDYAGFFQLKTSPRRNAPLTKAYIALFICLTTKALHLEVVCDLSTAEFIMAFENFISRRGIPQMLYTDNGTNFVGAAKEIKQFMDQMFEQNNALTRLLAENHIKFKRIPARASHMGGIWERAVGSVKYHLRRVLKDTKLNARQFDNLLKKIECCLNSKPLWAITGETDDIEVITPSHFYNFQAINTLPRPDLAHIPLNRLDQYQYLYRLYCDFWKAWHHEYLHQLQKRVKWQKEQPNAIVGQIVLVADDNLPPSRWPYGKIVGTYPAKDNLIRTVDVKCGKNVLRRPIHKLALLPIADNDELVEAKQLEPMSAQEGEDVDGNCQNQ